MKVLKTENEPKQTPDKILCNKCGKTIEKNEFDYFDDYLEVKKTWGYFSKSDGETHCFDICHTCYKDFINSFEIPIDKL